MSNKITGILHEVFAPDISKPEYPKQIFIIKVDENGFENFPKFQATKKAMDYLRNLSPGHVVEVSYSLKGRYYTQKDGKQGHFSYTECYSIKADGNSQFNGHTPAQAAPATQNPYSSPGGSAFASTQSNGGKTTQQAPDNGNLPF